MGKFRRENYEDYKVSDETVVEKQETPEDISEGTKEEAVAVAKEVVKKEEAAPKSGRYPWGKEEKKPSVPQLAKTNPDLTNIRAAADPNSAIVKTVAKGAEFKVDLDKSTDAYVAVSVQGEIAFIKRDLVTVYDNPAYTSNTVSKIG